MSDELTAWLREQIKARKAIAVAACEGGGGRWSRERDDPGRDLMDDRGEIVVYDEGSPSDAQFAHMEASDPRDVIARCEAELAILGYHFAAEHGHHGGPLLRCVVCVAPYECQTVRLLASGYRNHAGYREEWKPWPTS